MKLKNYFKKGLLSILASAMIIMPGCKKYKTEYSDVLQETAKVVSKEHNDEWMQIIPTQIGDITFNQIEYYSEENKIKFDGEIDFYIDNKEIFGRFSENEQADVFYRIKYKAVYDDVNKDGEDEFLERRIAAMNL